MKNKLPLLMLAGTLILAACNNSQVTTTSISSTPSSSSSITSSIQSSSSSKGNSSTSESPIGQDIKAYIFDEKGLIDGNPRISFNSASYTEVTNKAYEGQVPYYTFTYGASIKIKLKSTEEFIAKGVKVDGLLYLIDSNNESTFTAKLDDLDDFFLSIEVQYELVKGEEGDTSFDVKNSTHLTGTIYSDSSLTKATTSGNQNDYRYIKIASDSEDFYCQKITIYTYTSDIGSATYVDSIYDSSIGAYKFKVPYSYNKLVYVTLTEGNANLLKGTGIPGNYYTIWLASTSQGNKFGDKELSIDNGGTITFGANEKYNVYIESYEDGEAKLGNLHSLYVDENIVFFGNNGSTEGASGFGAGPFGSYDYLGIKRVDGDIYINYSVNYEIFKANNKKYAIVKVDYDSKEHVTCFIDYSNKKIYSNVAINYLYGDDFMDNEVMYEIKKDDTMIATISYSDEGGRNNRIVNSDIYGVYSGAKQLIYINSLLAIYDGEEYTPTLTNNTLVISNSSKEVTLEIDKENKTYNFVKEEATSSNIPVFKGLTFTGKGYDDWWECDTPMSVIFDNYDGDNISGKITWGSYPKYEFGFTATYDTGSKSLTFTITTQNYNVGVIGKTCKATVSEGKLTFTTNITSTYSTKNAIVNCSDFHI